jgi:hypothetical protein
MRPDQEQETTILTEMMVQLDEERDLYHRGTGTAAYGSGEEVEEILEDKQRSMANFVTALVGFKAEVQEDPDLLAKLNEI